MEITYMHIGIINIHVPICNIRNKIVVLYMVFWYFVLMCFFLFIDKTTFDHDINYLSSYKTTKKN